ncbi:MAG: RNA ligase family protein [Spirulinaceae cyanobacterium]
MPVIVMEVKSAEKHPHADTLQLYTMVAPGYEQVQIVANLENIYQVGDVVAVALVDSVLKDGTKIKPVKLRGIYSFGMALGKVEAAIARNLSQTYCQKEIVDNVQLQKWPSIELLANVRRSLEILEKTPSVTYRSKVKLDGTNGGVQIFANGKVAAQSRTQIITPESDNAGFAAWVNQNIDYFANLATSQHLTLFGEWCGKGIQKRTAIAQIERKVFAIFAVQYGGIGSQVAKLAVNPASIRALLPEHSDIFVLPFWGEAITLDFGNAAQLAQAAEKFNSLVEDVEAVDPWVEETFGIKGIGEGLVMYPQSDTLVDRLEYSQLLFKAKGDKHQVVKTKKPVQIAPEVAKGVDEFVEMFITPARLEQATTEACQGGFVMQKIGAFLKWVNTDVQKESVAELEAANLTWKQVNKGVTKAAKVWYQGKVMGNR